MSPPDKPEVPSTKDIAALIERLGDSDVSVREKAAREIFLRGFARAAAVTAEWLRDREIADCFVFDDSKSGAKFPRTTVGIAVQPESFEWIRQANGSPQLADVPPDLDAKEFELHAAEDVRLDVLTTREVQGGGAIARFLQKHGPGIQQVELEVHKMDRVTELLHARFGLAPVYAEPRAGADGTCVNFFLVASEEGGKLLIELVQDGGPSD
jgi:hypothetical protein